MTGDRLERVYIIGSEGSSVVKIGRTVDLERRIPALQTGSYLPLHVIWTCAGDNGLETYLHHHFAKFKTHGEWFDFGQDDPVESVKAAIRNRVKPVPKARQEDRHESADPVPSLAVRMEDAVSTRMANAEDAARLDLPEGSPIMVIERTYYGSGGEVVEFSTVLRPSGPYLVSYQPTDEELNSPRYW
ncbi:GIY-YIG nuclease family protein [Streptomyces jumonjinensis]|uniref:GIY-YIG nuclease family protein n=1 Tax=Streptomyces jumonjinensis TaxID=1945 RepID=UPI00331B10F6